MDRGAWWAKRRTQLSTHTRAHTHTHAHTHTRAHTHAHTHTHAHAASRRQEQGGQVASALTPDRRFPPVKMPDTRRVTLPGSGRRDKQNAPRTGVCVSRRWSWRGRLLWGLCCWFRGNPVPWHSLGIRRLWSVPVALA